MHVLHTYSTPMPAAPQTRYLRSGHAAANPDRDVRAAVAHYGPMLLAEEGKLEVRSMLGSLQGGYLSF